MEAGPLNGPYIHGQTHLIRRPLHQVKNLVNDIARPGATKTNDTSSSNASENASVDELYYNVLWYDLFIPNPFAYLGTLS